MKENIMYTIKKEKDLIPEYSTIVSDVQFIVIYKYLV